VVVFLNNFLSDICLNVNVVHILLILVFFWAILFSMWVYTFSFNQGFRFKSVLPVRPNSEVKNNFANYFCDAQSCDIFSH